MVKYVLRKIYKYNGAKKIWDKFNPVEADTCYDFLVLTPYLWTFACQLSPQKITKNEI